MACLYLEKIHLQKKNEKFTCCADDAAYTRNTTTKTIGLSIKCVRFIIENWNQLELDTKPETFSIC